MLPGRNLEALQNIGLKGVNRGGKTNRRGGRERMGEGGKPRRNTKTRNEESIGRRLEVADDQEKNGRRRRRRRRGRRRRESEKERERVRVNEGVIHGAPAARFPVRGRKVLISRNYVRPAPATSTNFQFLRLLMSSSNSSPMYRTFPVPRICDRSSTDEAISDVMNWPATLMSA